MRERRESTFHFKVNGGAEQIITCRTGVYVSVAGAIPAMFGYEPDQFPLEIEIWVPDPVEYGPYFYYIEQVGGKVGTLVTRPDGDKLVIYS